MVKRVSYRPYFFVAFALMVMMFCWESNRIQAAVLDSSIPKDSIRIRILANSDSVQDQWIKRQVQLEVVKEISTWVLDPQNLEQAREEIRANIPVLENIVDEVLVTNGYPQQYQVELAKVPFPVKQFGTKEYPAGDYEALRIVLGSGQGQNWWCVLFPPLCFIGVKAQAATIPIEAAPTPSAKPTATAKASPAKTADKPSNEKPQGKTASISPTVGKAQVAAAAVEPTAPPKPEVKFFLWEAVKKVISVVKSLFA